MAYITNQNLTLAHIDALINLCGFTIITDSNSIRAVKTDNGETIEFSELSSARDYLVHQLLIRRTMAQLATIV